ncbi:uncharacterized protein THITE_2110931 [Thermothielavioides terrestris NRRL 8126]|uniref:Uncharacterized protein n=1 Tax=Thermothielavioides terrestris (strain ATCC 38088 / NRRL 8126) TaxID=578455 RepID=G2QVF8_THETT|nr:uncharacterized protein THITE_2110931 [Thermothielavioides terrestris NRRL 8126]AEO64648.1 hypothetical protein THITE_2110931 [Thermothielavioides terrestris NRRL 8126]
MTASGYAADAKEEPSTAVNSTLVHRQATVDFEDTTIHQPYGQNNFSTEAFWLDWAWNDLPPSQLGGTITFDALANQRFPDSWSAEATGSHWVTSSVPSSTGTSLFGSPRLQEVSLFLLPTSDSGASHLSPHGCQMAPCLDYSPPWTCFSIASDNATGCQSSMSGWNNPTTAPWADHRRQTTPSPSSLDRCGSPFHHGEVKPDEDSLQSYCDSATCRRSDTTWSHNVSGTDTSKFPFSAQRTSIRGRLSMTGPGRIWAMMAGVAGGIHGWVVRQLCLGSVRTRKAMALRI